jgi:aspartate carbamoyltransferase catalytic subunit
LSSIFNLLREIFPFAQNRGMVATMKHLLRSKELTYAELEALMELADHYWPVVQERRKVNDAEGKILATLFYEPSTRTRFSFEAAMTRLGGDVISNSHMNYTSSAKKGETLYDTGKVVSQMADILVMRHPDAGSILELADGSDVPVVNGGDGPADHTTQGLLDLFTIKKELGRLNDFTIAMVGDLKYSRVVHSQCHYLKHFKGVRFLFVSPEALKMPEAITSELRGLGFDVVESDDLEAVMPEMDVLSDTRIQEERFPSRAEYEKYNGVYILTPELMSKAKEKMIVIDPLPRVNHIDVRVDDDPRAVYFKQVQYGVAMRMAILAKYLGLK